MMQDAVDHHMWQRLGKTYALDICFYRDIYWHERDDEQR